MGMVLLATLDWLHGVPPEEIVKKGRYPPPVHAGRAVVRAGRAQRRRSKQTLEKYGHKLRESRQPGNMQIVTWDYRSGER